MKYFFEIFSLTLESFVCYTAQNMGYKGRKINKIKGAAPIIEYAVLLSIIIAALITISAYLRRAVSSKWRQVGDTFGFGRQYEPSVTRIMKIP